MLTDNTSAPLILIVEDDDSHADLINRAFAGAQEKFRLETVGSIRAAETAIERCQPTLILTDLRLPDGEGIELVSLPNRCWPVVVMTSHGNEQVAVDAMKAGAMDYLVKTPDSFATLPRLALRLLREWELTQKRIRSEEQLRKNEVRQRAMIENIVDVIAIIDQDGINRYKSPNIEKWFGWRVEDEVGSPAWVNIHPDDLEATRKVFAALLRQPSAENSAECRYRCKDGSYKWVAFTAVNLMHDPDIGGVLLSYHDITERKRSEEEQRLLEQQFHHAQKLESLGVLSGGIAHDFNNILTVILGHCYIAREGLEPEKSHKASIQKIETAANRAADLCRQMLTYAGKNATVQKEVELCQLVDDVVKMLYAAINKNVTIELDFKGDSHHIRGDSSQIEQIVMNLVINAAEAIGDANGTVRVGLAAVQFATDAAESDTFGTPILPGRYICLEVSDTGCGMDEETQKRIFEPFYTTKITGRGLGMAAVLGIIKAHNGLLRMTTAPGSGTTFKVCFPVAPTSEIGVPAPETAARYISTADSTVLLVEDEQILRDMGTTLLEAYGFSVLTAQHGREAVEIYGRCGSDIHVVMLDLIMPVMGGIETYHELRRTAPTLPIIICSGYGVESVEGAIDNDPYAGFVCKPYKPEQLRVLLTEMISAGNR